MFVHLISLTLSELWVYRYEIASSTPCYHRGCRPPPLCKTMLTSNKNCLVRRVHGSLNIGNDYISVAKLRLDTTFAFSQEMSM